jgi:hypothetical protein
MPEDGEPLPHCLALRGKPLTMDSAKTATEASPPSADASSAYHAVLQESAKAYPRATEALMRSERHRLRRWRQFIDLVDLQAIDLLLGYLESISALLGSTALPDLEFLSDRVADDVRASFEGILSGYLQIASDAMRDIIEVELLARDFASDPERITRWRNASKTKRRNYFGPAEIRKRQAAALGIKPHEVSGASDYAAHSQLLHAGPPVLFPRAPGPGTLAGLRVIYILDALADVMRHGRSAAEALHLLLNALNRPAPDPDNVIAALSAAFDDAMQARVAAEVIERRTAELLPVEGNWTSMLFESGLLIAFNPDRPQMDTYMIDRTDFRTAHRHITDNQPVSFRLTALQDEPSDPASQQIADGQSNDK